jgi:hypothetical protein
MKDPDRAEQSASVGTSLGDGVDRTAIRKLLALSYAERARLAVEEARNLRKFDDALRRR